MNPRGRRQRLSSIQQIAETLRQSDDVAAPDLTGSILDAVDAERPFLSAPTRRMVIAGRFALGFTVVCFVAGVALAHRWAPSLFELTARPAPLSSVVENVRSEAQVTLADFQRQVQTVAVSTSAASPASAQVFVSLIAPTKPAAGKTVSASFCTMVGPTLSPAEAARHCCQGKAAASSCCAFRPLGGIAGMPGLLVPDHSSWKAMSQTRGPEVGDIESSLLDPVITPR